MPSVAFCHSVLEFSTINTSIWSGLFSAAATSLFSSIICFSQNCASIICQGLPTSCKALGYTYICVPGGWDLLAAVAVGNTICSIYTLNSVHTCTYVWTAHHPVKPLGGGFKRERGGGKGREWEREWKRRWCSSHTPCWLCEGTPNKRCLMPYCKLPPLNPIT